MYQHLTDGNNGQPWSLWAPNLNDNYNWNKVEKKLKKNVLGIGISSSKLRVFLTPNEWFYPLVLVVECLVVECAAPRIVFLLISHVQQDFICSFPREMSKGWPTLKMVGKAMAHPQMYSMCWKPANFSKDVLYWAAPRVQTKTMRVQSNKTKPIPGRQSALSLSQFIDQPKRCCNIKNPNKNKTQSRLGRRSSPSSREPHLPLIWTALSFPWFFQGRGNRQWPFLSPKTNLQRPK